MKTLLPFFPPSHLPFPPLLLSPFFPLSLSAFSHHNMIFVIPIQENSIMVSYKVGGSYTMVIEGLQSKLFYNTLREGAYFLWLMLDPPLLEFDNNTKLPLALCIYTNVSYKYIMCMWWEVLFHRGCGGSGEDILSGLRECGGVWAVCYCSQSQCWMSNWICFQCQPFHHW